MDNNSKRNQTGKGQLNKLEQYERQGFKKDVGLNWASKDGQGKKQQTNSLGNTLWLTYSYYHRIPVLVSFNCTFVCVINFSPVGL